MSFSATIIADSVSTEGIRITTMQLRYPRFIHPELMTHRDFSRNASSSRAVPVERMIQDILNDTAMPIYWGSNQPGMQAGEQISERDIALAKGIWLDARDEAINFVKRLTNLHLHKQVANRVLEPFSHINVLVTSTKWDNFYALRRHKDAQPEFQYLANLMYDVHEQSQPKLLKPTEWHLPYIEAKDHSFIKKYVDKYYANESEDEQAKLGRLIMLKVSVARCARVSYLTHNMKATTVEQDIILYNRLLESQPLHASPAEHQALPDVRDKVDWEEKWKNPELHGNLHGYIQFRKTLDNEYV